MFIRYIYLLYFCYMFRRYDVTTNLGKVNERSTRISRNFIQDRDRRGETILLPLAACRAAAAARAVKFNSEIYCNILLPILFNTYER